MEGAQPCWQGVPAMLRPGLQGSLIVRSPVAAEAACRRRIQRSPGDLMAVSAPATLPLSDLRDDYAYVVDLVRSKQRVADHGEVFTPAPLVESMLNL